MDPELLSWAQILALELVQRGHPSLQATLMAGLFSKSQQWQNYFTHSVDTSTPKGCCILYASVGLVDQLQQAMVGQSFFENELLDIIAAAARGGHWPLLKHFFGRDYYIKPDGHVIQLTLENAIKGGHEEMVSTMLSFDMPGLPLTSLLCDAAKAGHVRVMKLLLQASDTPHTEKRSNSILFCAIYGRSVAMVSTALSLEPAPTQDCIARVAVEAAGIEDQPVEIIELLQGGLNSRRQNQMLVAACKAGNLELARYLLDRGVVSWLKAALRACAKNPRIELVELLLSQGARDADGYLAAHGGLEIARLLLARGTVNPNQVLKHQQLYHQPATLKLVLESGADRLEPALTLALTIVNCAEGIQSTLMLLEAGAPGVNAALVAGARKGCLPVVELAIELGATAYQEAMDQAAHCGQEEMVRLLGERSGLPMEASLLVAQRLLARWRAMSVL